MKSKRVKPSELEETGADVGDMLARWGMSRELCVTFETLGGRGSVVYIFVSKKKTGTDFVESVNFFFRTGVDRGPSRFGGLVDVKWWRYEKKQPKG